MQSRGLLLMVGLITFWDETSLISGQPDICHLPKVAGPCDAYFPSYFFHTKTKKCEEFIYGGCGGNANRFKTLMKCHYTCKGKPGNCPKYPPETITTCDAKCGNDWDCLGSYKCCTYGCTRRCYRPV